MKNKQTPGWLSDKELSDLGEIEEVIGCLVKFECGWVFFDETWANAFGPFQNQEEASIHLDMYLTRMN